MRQLLLRPIEARDAARVVPAILAAIALYCIAYSQLSGQDETLGDALVWGVIFVLPWLLAFELQKRARSLWGVVALIALFLTLSMLAGWIIRDHALDAFELVRRLPGGLAVAGLAGLTRLFKAQSRSPDAAPRELPATPAGYDQVRAAGNYVELVGGAGTLTCRATLASAERLYAGDFIRIHRSTLVRRAAIDRVSGDDVVLHDGTRLAIGKRYRASL